MHRRVAVIVLSSFLLSSCSAFQLTSHSYTPPEMPAGVMAAVPQVVNGRPDTFAVIVGLNTEEYHRGNISLAYQVMIELGLKRKDIFILDVASELPYFPKTDTTSRASMDMLFTSLARIIEPHDELIVYMTGHGVLDEDGQAALMLNPAERMPADEFIMHLDSIDVSAGLLFVDQCYWGPRHVPSGCNWTTITTAREGQVTSAATFPRALWGALRAGLRPIRAAFDRAVRDDRGSTLGLNSPVLSAQTCGEPLSIMR